jgi:hypothetical protein
LEELERLLEREVEAPSPADVDAYLAQNPAAASAPDARARAADYLTEQRRIQTRVDLLAALRHEAHFKMLLVPPREPSADSGREPARRALPAENPAHDEP